MPARTDDMQGLAAKLVPPLRAWFTGVESGSWTPILAGSSTGGTFSYDRQTGIYRKMGDLIYIAGRARISAISVAAVGALLMGGIPYTPLTTGTLPGFALDVAYYASLNLTAGALGVTCYAATTNAIAFQEVYDNAGNANVNSALLSVGTDIVIGGFYIATE